MKPPFGGCGKSDMTMTVFVVPINDKEQVELCRTDMDERTWLAKDSKVARSTAELDLTEPLYRSKYYIPTGVIIFCFC